jgi:hypothetical protein
MRHDETYWTAPAEGDPDPCPGGRRRGRIGREVVEQGVERGIHGDLQDRHRDAPPAGTRSCPQKLWITLWKDGCISGAIRITSGAGSDWSKLHHNNNKLKNMMLRVFIGVLCLVSTVWSGNFRVL